VNLASDSSTRLVHPTAYHLQRAAWYSGVAWLPILLITFAIAITNFRFFSTHFWIAGPFFAGLFVSTLADAVGRMQVGRELDRGYTTLLRFGNLVDIRDSATGTLLRRAGAPVRGRTMKLLRQHAEMFGATPAELETRVSDVSPAPLAFGEHSVVAARSETDELQRRSGSARAVVTVVASFIALAGIARFFLFAVTAGSPAAVMAAILLALGVPAGVILVPVVMGNRRSRLRLRRIHGDNPEALLVEGYRTVELVGVLSRLAPNRLQQRTLIWTFDSEGCVLWDGSALPRQLLRAPWGAVVEVVRGEAINDLNNSFPCVSVQLRVGDDCQSLSFFPRRPGILSSFRAPERTVEELTRRITDAQSRADPRD
jgi:hypothetical protein